MTALTDFLIARIDEDAANLDCGFNDHDGATYLNGFTSETCPCDFREKREVQAKRAAVALLASTDSHEIHPDGWTVAKWALRLVALSYADHPDYDEEWRP